MFESNAAEILCALSDIGIDIHITDYAHASLTEDFAPDYQDNIIQQKMSHCGADVSERDTVSGAFKHFIPPHFRPEPKQENVSQLRQQVPNQAMQKSTRDQKPYQRLVTANTAIINPIEVKRPIDDKLSEIRAICENLHTVQDVIDAVHGYDSGTEWQNLASSTVFFDGYHDANILFIGDIPSKEDEAIGKPLSGNVDVIISQLIKYILGEEPPKIAKANMLFWRTINANAHSHYFDLCLPFIQRLISIMAPKKIILLGATTTGYLADAKGTMMSLRGTTQNIKIEPHTYPAFVTFHPLYLLRVPIAKKFFWLDMLKFLSED